MRPDPHILDAIFQAVYASRRQAEGLGKVADCHRAAMRRSLAKLVRS